MTEINGQEMFIAVLLLIAWCMFSIKMLGIWANKQYYDLRKIARTEMQAITRELTDKVESNTAQAEKIHRRLDLTLIEIDAKLECLMDNNSQISGIDVRTIEIARMVRRIPEIEFQLREAVRSKRCRPYLEYMSKDCQDQYGS